MEHLHGGNLIKAAKKSGFEPEELIDFSANINFLGPPEIILDEIKRNVKGIENYPEANAKRIKKLIAEHHQLSKQSVTVGSGASELIYQITKVLKPKKVMVVDPTFSEYELAAKSIGAEVCHFKLKKENDFKIDSTKVIAELSEDIDLIFICNPNNPTGALLNLNKIEEILAAASAKDILFVLDEAFIDFLSAAEDYTALKLLDKYSNLIIMRSLTKLFALPGLRLGYTLAAEDISIDLEKNRDPWSVNYFAQLAAEIIFTERKEIEQYLEKSFKKIAAEKNYLYSNLQQIEDLKVFKANANFIFIDISETGLSAKKLQNKLLESKIMIRNCDSYNGLEDDYIRIAIKDRKNNELLINNLKKILNQS
ncbi:threonine-phosphate decarboxylase CobD [Halanaerobium hydrogeniformans]|uniref:threonine-phosphate decarboxylase n=1 Tax=Halanaerobium hydrogeniformans TaxID=656519 RepID=E4RK33_HALHG|nr:threonine-phosphate decarboxylase CobD [Halanaerobium hydrogeniformans]ADQ15603.1 aminotransferase class I and II [Halanaerobium hydrogeniformans]